MSDSSSSGNQKTVAVGAGGATVGISTQFLPWMYVLIIVGVIILTLVIVWLIYRLRDKRNAAALNDGLGSQAAAVPRGISDPKKRAQLDSMRQSFNKGLARVIEEGKRKGIDYLYRHPWLLMIGDSGSGKTEIVRHSNLGFPPGAESEFMGAGGTINMDWWFTEKAVVLDTAGRLMVEEVASGQNNQWTEFLKLLGKHRKLTPINGLLLVISAETLITEGAEKLRERADRARAKLSEIQASLKIRFPVYIIISKCDKIQGFREFFDNFGDSNAAQQILGWSKPAPLDEPFGPNIFIEHFDQVIGQLRRFRTTQLAETYGNYADARSIDATDNLYEFPNALAGLRNNLRNYLEMVFTAGEWSASAPLFMRGVYFCSALRKGAVLDQELATALGIPVGDISNESSFASQEKTLFVRDLFAKKIIAEKGLVTGNSRADGMVKRRHTIVACTLALICIGLGLALYFNHRSLRQSIGNELQQWQVVLAGQTASGEYQPIVERVKGPSLAYTLVPGMPGANSDESPLSFYTSLEQATRTPLNIPFIYQAFTDLDKTINPLRRSAQLAVFESGVLHPLFDAFHERMRTQSGPWTEADTRLLLALIRIEDHLNSSNKAHPRTMLAFEAALRGIPGAAATPNGPQIPLLNAEQIKALRELLNSTYTPVFNLEPHWPAANLSAGATLADNATIRHGITNLIEFQSSALSGQTDAVSGLRSLRDALRQLAQVEDGIPNIPLGRGGKPMVSRWEDSINAYLQQAESVQQLLEQYSKARGREPALLSTPGQPSLTTALNELSTRSAKVAEGLASVLPISDTSSTSADGSSSNTTLTTPLQREISDTLRAFDKSVKAKSEQFFTAKERSEMQLLDTRFFSLSAAGHLAMNDRIEDLNRIKRLIQRHRSGELRMLGDLASNLLGEGSNATPEAALNVTGLIPRIQRDVTLDLYFSEAEASMDASIGFPLILDGEQPGLSIAQLATCRETWSKILQDTEILPKSLLASRHREKIDKLRKLIGKLRPVVDALLRADGRGLNMVSIEIPPSEDQQAVIVEAMGDAELPMRQMASSVWRDFAVGNKRQRLEGGANLQRFALSSDQPELFFYCLPEDKTPTGDSIKPLRAWKILSWMKDPSTKRSEDGKTWTVLVRLRDPAEDTRILVLTLKFDVALPELADWPTRANLGLNLLK